MSLSRKINSYISGQLNPLKPANNMECTFTCGFLRNSKCAITSHLLRDIQRPIPGANILSPRQTQWKRLGYILSQINPTLSHIIIGLCKIRLTLPSHSAHRPAPIKLTAHKFFQIRPFKLCTLTSLLPARMYHHHSNPCLHT